MKMGYTASRGERHEVDGLSGACSPTDVGPGCAQKRMIVATSRAPGHLFRFTPSAHLLDAVLCARKEQVLMQVIHERCAGIDIHKILPNRNHLFLMISQRASILMFFSSLDVVEDR
jgi:hypothetical protein